MHENPPPHMSGDGAGGGEELEGVLVGALECVGGPGSGNGDCGRGSSGCGGSGVEYRVGGGLREEGMSNCREWRSVPYG